MKTYSFVEQLEKGAKGEKVLDEYFKQWYDIREATIEQQKDEKIDRLFSPKQRPAQPEEREWIKVEYKTDDRTDDTGNLFIETWSSVEHRRYGWAYASKADMIVYYALPDTIYLIDRQDLLRILPDWLKVFKTHRIKNKGYTTEGLAVPVEHILHLIGKKRVRRLS
jgi:hypothetical protein